MSKFCSAGGAAFSSDRMDWETPLALFKELDAEFNFTLDAASSDSNAKCKKHYTIEDDGLKKNWGGERVFVNPPYGREIAKWVEKGATEAKQPNTLVVMLLPARTDTRYFHDFIYKKAEIRFLRGRVKFCINGEERQPAPFPSMIVIFRPQKEGTGANF